MANNNHFNFFFFNSVRSRKDKTKVYIAKVRFANTPESYGFIVANSKFLSKFADDFSDPLAYGIPEVEYSCSDAALLFKLATIIFDNLSQFTLSKKFIVFCILEKKVRTNMNRLNVIWCWKRLE